MSPRVTHRVLCRSRRQTSILGQDITSLPFFLFITVDFLLSKGPKRKEGGGGSLLEFRRVEGTNPGKNRKKLAVMGEKVQERAYKIWSPLAGCGMAAVFGG